MEFRRARISYCFGGKGVRLCDFKGRGCDKFRFPEAMSVKIVSSSNPVPAIQRPKFPREACEHKTRQSRCRACKNGVPANAAYVIVTKENGEICTYYSAICKWQWVLTDGVDIIYPHTLPITGRLDRPSKVIESVIDARFTTHGIMAYTVIYVSGKTETVSSRPANIQFRAPGYRLARMFDPIGIPNWDPITSFPFEYEDDQKVYDVLGSLAYSTRCSSRKW